MKIIKILFILFISIQLNAQDSYLMEEVDIKDVRSGVELRKLGRQIEVINQRMIQDMPVRTVDELLRYIPGLEVQSRGMNGVQSDFSMRGATFNQTVVLLDGIRIGDALTGHFNSYIPVNLKNIKRIEIIKGAGSTVYGADAVGGVINIVTQAMDDTEVDVKQYFADDEIEYSAGQFNYQNLSGNFEKSNGRYYAEAFIDYSNSTGHEAFSFDNNYEFRMLRGSFALDYAFTNTTDQPANRIKVRAAYDERDIDARYFYTQSSFDLSQELIERTFGQVMVDINTIESHKIKLNAGINKSGDLFAFNPDFPANDHTTINTNVNIYDNINLNTSSSLTIGAEMRNSDMESTDRGNRDQFQYGVYASYDNRISEKIGINAGVRSETLPTKVTELVPQFGLNYFPTDDITVRANAGKAVRTPTFTERYVSTGLPGVLSDGRNVGNPDLNTEKSFNYELGTDIYFENSIDIKLTGYYRDSEDLIDYSLTPGSQINNVTNIDENEEYFYARNISELTVYGIEGNISGRTKLSSINLDWFAGFNVIQFDIADDQNSKYITNAAGLNISGGLTVSYKGFRLGSNFIYRQRDADAIADFASTLSESYFVVNTNLSYQLTSDLRLNVQVNNLLDEQYSDILGAELPGRWITGGIEIGL